MDNIQEYFIKKAHEDMYTGDYIKINPLSRYPMEKAEVRYDEDGEKIMFLPSGYVIYGFLDAKKNHIVSFKKGQSGYALIRDANLPIELKVIHQEVPKSNTKNGWRIEADKTKKELSMPRVKCTIEEHKPKGT